MKNLLALLLAGQAFTSLAQTNTFPSSGNVGIGTTTPNTSLAIRGRLGINANANPSAPAETVRIEGATSGEEAVLNITNMADQDFLVRLSGVGAGTKRTIIGPSTNTRFSLGVGVNSSNEYLTLINGGNVGIGTVSPSSKLHLSASDRTQALRVYADGNTTNYLSIGQGSGGAVIDPIGTSLLYMGYDIPASVIMGYGGGNVGIGNISTPTAMLHINSPVERQTFRLYKNGNTSNYLSVWQGTGGAAIDPIGTGKLYLGYDKVTDTYVNGKLGIGTTNPDYPLTVNGSIHAKEVRVDLSVPGPDYVFANDYKLLSLEEIKNYIDENKHLPEVPSAKEMEKDGVQLGEMNMLLLKKIEELTLYVIEQNKKMDEIKRDNEKEIQELKKLINTNK